MPGPDSEPFSPEARSNVNSVWGALAMEVLARLGLETVVVSPGSRSTPLALAAVRNPRLEAIPVLDERSAAFFALGHAKRTHKPVALVCTSGTAAANYYPAVIEASMSGTPLLILTADRPPELRDCFSGQTIDQIKLFGDFVREFHEIALPEVSKPMLDYLRQTLVHAVDHARNGNPGPVHLNFPFRDPLSPQEGCEPVVGVELLERCATVAVRSCEPVAGHRMFDDVVLERLASHRRGLIVVGSINPVDGEAFADGVALLSRKLGWPVLSDVLNPLRGHGGENEALVCHYDAILRRDGELDDLVPTAVLQIGPLPTGKVLREWLAGNEAMTFLLSDRPVNTDPLHRVAVPLRGEAHALAEVLPHQKGDAEWLARWKAAEFEFASAIDKRIESLSGLFEGKAAWLLARHLPTGTPVFIAGSMPVRYAEFFWSPESRAYSIYANRGANGIDGTLGTAMGIAHGGRPSVLLTGDLAFLHDSNALFALPAFRGSLTVVLINNRGGGIFEHLPVAACGDSFERFFATPQAVDLEAIVRSCGAEYQRIKDWDTFVDRISRLPESGIRVLEIATDRKADRGTLAKLLSF